ncbi:hypothetical protein TeGR_g3260 [Tetraparma gracilis]|uniref:Uncharacterized protein n=1 Tax=Tetraparma gracilis TaxID=2962635 RepID=A0ABQ6N0Z1_9STRA|nr:hypothetical protein TeGR_g3260 [Tetraparma gracilis]
MTLVRSRSRSYLIIDEAHRLKNEASQFANTVRQMNTRNRLLLTGTPLQNNLHELWALLNFILPDIFSSADQFDEWFDLGSNDDDAKKDMISTLHKVLRPFMLRRLKVDVAKGLPPKSETLLMVGMSAVQKALYKKLLLRDIESLSTGSKSATSVLNILMQLRKCCGHPYLFEGVEDRSQPALGEHLVESCGKFVLMDKLLKRLKEKGHRVLVFTQMTRILDILEDYCVMRQHKYCRIDGGTDYETREEMIESYNKENSEKFIFLLSTRAGGLGINLQTADTVILFDSDWNPQADLQAQDRAHRIGQKKPVHVYRLVTENSVEEKIVERAQQKLKLDAMVVQSGRLKEKDKVTKEDVMAAIKFGADAVFRSETSDITDDDIDAILARGEEKTKAMAEKLKVNEKGDMLDFSLDGDINYQSLDGVDYSDREFRDHLRMMSAETIGKRERRPTANAGALGTTSSSSGTKAVVRSQKFMMIDGKIIHLPAKFRLPRMEAHMFYDQKRLLEISELEFESYAALRANGTIERMSQLDGIDSVLPEELAEEKKALLRDGFQSFTKRDYYRFVRGVVAHGRDNIASIAKAMSMTEEVVAAYSQRFWEVGKTQLGDVEWARVQKVIEAGEEKVRTQKQLEAHLTSFLGGFENPRQDIVFTNRSRMVEYSTHTLEHDRAILCAVDEYGYGNWDEVQREMRKDDNLLFSHGVQAMSIEKITQRTNYRLKQLERELETRERVENAENGLNSARADAQKALALSAAIISAETGEPVDDGGDPFFKATVQAEVEQKKASRALWKSDLAKIDTVVKAKLLQADEARQQILRGDQHVNLSAITLKGELGETAILSTVGHVAAPASVRASTEAKFDAKGNPIEKRKRKRNRSPANPDKPPPRRKPVLDEETYAELANKVGVFGNNERKTIVEEFATAHSGIWTEKEANEAFGRITVRKKPACVPKHEKLNPSREKPWFYLRPALYTYLPDEQRQKVPSWEAAQAADDVLFKREEEEKKAKQKKYRKSAKDKQKLIREEANLQKYGSTEAPRGRKMGVTAEGGFSVGGGADESMDMVSQDEDASMDMSMDMDDDVVEAEVVE